ncbi:methyl-accepting chemotaxis protein [Alicyclobacillus shizuokensis]|uniref:methyl-accepting chemotaxis protein n=1 Tax=Alicyclobacillus shizuokensis TaxID=392014 RepID=UPI00082B7FDD|nr:methyl-accepting chemotaxis protein [Alicyclobacillus shizuokensis]MCL6624972.1 cache domain-containing protein [Alicyclobacillus shizuokensis]
MNNLRLGVFLSSLRIKLLAMSLAMLMIPSLVIGLVTYEITKKQLEAAGEQQLKQDVLHVFALIDEANMQVKAGRMTLAAAQEMVKEQVLGPKDKQGHRPINPRFKIGSNGYIIAINDHAVSLMNPLVEGQDNWNQKTVDGVMSGREMVRLAAKGGGYLTYMWPLPNSKGVAKKIVYVQKDPDWGWNVAAGSYMADFEAPANQVLHMLLIVLVLEVVLGALASLWLAGRIAKPITKMAHQVERVAAGDLSVEPLVKRGNDEISRLAAGFSRMMNHLRDLIKNISETSEQLAASAEELSASAEENMRATEQVTQTAQDVAAGAERQVHTVGEGANAVNHIAGAMEQIAHNAQEASASAAKAVEISKLGNDSIQSVHAQMSSIQEIVDQAAVVVRGLGERSQEIGRIVEVITDIAEQTNLLALNAAIEAARAGEHGRSFAVVAGEVRKLAEHSSQSAQQIADLISSIQQESQAAVQSMEASTSEVSAGLHAVHDAGESFGQIGESVSEVVRQFEEVFASVRQLTDRAEQLQTLMGNVSTVTDSTSAGMQTVFASTEEQLASMEEISASAQSLNRMAEQLQTLVGQFKM